MPRKYSSYEEEREREHYPRHAYRGDEEDEAAQLAAIRNQSPVLRDLVEQMHAALSEVLNVNEKCGSARITTAASTHSVSSPPSLCCRSEAVLAR